MPVYKFNDFRRETELENRRLELAEVHSSAINKFQNSIDQFAVLVSGMKAFVHINDKFPSDTLLQAFIQGQLNDIGFKDFIVVSFVDTNHIFKYSFTRYDLDPSGLVGRSVGAMRDGNELDRLNRLMQSDEMLLFKPINLVEGWIGIPLNFRVRRNGVTLGYIAPIIDFKTMLS